MQKVVDKKKWVVNLSSWSLTNEEEKVLQKGMKFSPAPLSIPKTEFVVKVEAALSDHVQPERAERDRAAVSSVLRSAKRPKANVSKEERKALSTLRKDKNIVVLEADKGNATVVMDATAYEQKAMDIIGEHPFRRVPRDPTGRNEKRVNGELRRLETEGAIS